MNERGLQWRLTALMGGITAIVVAVFVLASSLVLRGFMEDRAIGEARDRAQEIAFQAAAAGPAVTETDPAALGVPDDGSTSIILPNDRVLGAPLNLSGVLGSLDRARDGGAAFEQRTDEGVVVYAPAVARRRGVIVVRTVVTRGELYAGDARVTAGLLGFGLLALGVAVAAAHAFTVRFISAPIRRLVHAANALREGRLDTRTPERGPPEILVLARSLNRLAGRVKELLALERESVADLSHRLRTPVTALRLDADSIRDPELADRLRQHVAQLERTVDAVVRDARRPARDSGAPVCDVAQVVAERVAFWSALAEEQGRPLSINLPWTPAWARIDQNELIDSVDVLIDNVFAHTAEGAPLRVSVEVVTGRYVVMVVEDGGTGLPDHDVVARGSSGAGSSGLGLDIVRRVAIASGGTLELGRSAMGGALVRVLLGSADSDPQPQRMTGERLRRDRHGRDRSRSAVEPAPPELGPAEVSRIEPAAPRPDERRRGRRRKDPARDRAAG